MTTGIYLQYKQYERSVSKSLIFKGTALFLICRIANWQANSMEQGPSWEANKTITLYYGTRGLGCYITWIGRYLPAFRNNLSVPF